MSLEGPSNSPRRKEVGAKPKKFQLMPGHLRDAWLRDDGSFERMRDAGLRTIAKQREVAGLQKARTAREEAERKRQTNEDIIPPTPDDVVERVTRTRVASPSVHETPVVSSLEPLRPLDELSEIYDDLKRRTKTQRVREALELQKERNEIRIDPQTGAIEPLLEDD